MTHLERKREKVWAKTLTNQKQVEPTIQDFNIFYHTALVQEETHTHTHTHIVRKAPVSQRECEHKKTEDED